MCGDMALDLQFHPLRTRDSLSASPETHRLEPK